MVGFQPPNHNQQKCKMFPNNHHVLAFAKKEMYQREHKSWPQDKAEVLAGMSSVPSPNDTELSVSVRPKHAVTPGNSLKRVHGALKSPYR